MNHIATPVAPIPSPKPELCLPLPTGELHLRLLEGAARLDELLGFGARENQQRGFLFVSKVLGKHWPVKPSIMRAIHDEMAAQVPLGIPGPVLFIAMAETAIGLGQGVFEAYQRANPQVSSVFIHSTRYHLPGHTTLEFAETHSHAPRQFLHVPEDPQLAAVFQGAGTLVLVDDEASTGNTFLNLTHACRAQNPALQCVHLATLANFMGTEHSQQLSQRFGLPVTLGALISGEYSFTPGVLATNPTPAQLFQAHAERGASGVFGRLGVNKELAIPHLFAEQLKPSLLPKGRILVLGTGEFMHMAFLLGLALENLDFAVRVQATTRSPILPWGAINQKLSFADNYGEGVPNFIYNLPTQTYDHILICHETPVNDELRHLARTLEGRLIFCKTETHLEEIPVY